MRRVFLHLNARWSLTPFSTRRINELKIGYCEIDCRRGPIFWLMAYPDCRIICHHGGYFQAEYSSGQPLRMLVDLRASVYHALVAVTLPEAPARGPLEF